MSDVMPDYGVEQQKLHVQVANLRAQLERYKLEIMEADSKKVQANKNIVATKEAITRTEENIASLAGAHGPVKKKEKQDG